VAWKIRNEAGDKGENGDINVLKQNDMQTIMSKQTTYLIKKFHVLCGQLRIDEYARQMLLIDNYGVTSSKDLDYTQLMELCMRLETQANPALKELDGWRKRCLASIGGWLRSTGGEESMTYIKAIACKAAEQTDFNKIPLAMLRNLYYEFRNKQKVRQRVNVIDSERVLKAISFN
jgi:hypothetical protein